MSDQPFVPCRVVELEWDRSHESFTAIVRAESQSGIIISQIHDLSTVRGLRWIRADEIVSLEDVTPEDPARRLADRRGELTVRVDDGLTELGSLLELLSGLATPLAIYRERTGSDELLVGSHGRVRDGRLELTEIDSRGELTGDQLTYDLDEIIAVDWGTDYLDALAELVALTSEGPDGTERTR